MFSTSIRLHTYTCRLTRQTIVMSISAHLCSVDIARKQPQQYWSSSHAHPTSMSSGGILTSVSPSPYHDCHMTTQIEHLVYPLVTSSSCSYTHTLVTLTRLHHIRITSSHPSVSLISYAWHSRMSGHISVQRIKVANKSITHSRSICLSTLIT
jgi:hypothetical protein